MAKQAKTSKQYSTAEVCAVLGIPDWRLKNYVTGDAYGIAPSGRKGGKGRGVHRRYTLTDVYRIALAQELVRFGFGPGPVGRAVGEVPVSALEARALSPDDLSKATFLIQDEKGWRVVTGAEEVNKLAAEAVQGEQDTLVVLNLSSLFYGVFRALERYFLGE